MEKACIKCQLIKPVSEFDFCGKKKHGDLRRRDCKDCRKRAVRERTAAKPKPEKPVFTSKVCKVCATEKPLSDFRPKRRTCHACESAVYQEYRRLNPAKCRESRYYSDRKHREKRLAVAAAYRERNREKMRVYAAERAKNREKLREIERRYLMRHPEKQREKHLRRKALMRKASVIGRINIMEVIKRDNSTCYLCGKLLSHTSITIDHVIPISRGGSHTTENVRVACARCNSRKHNKLLSELTWYCPGVLARFETNPDKATELSA